MIMGRGLEDEILKSVRKVASAINVFSIRDILAFGQDKRFFVTVDRTRDFRRLYEAVDRQLVSQVWKTLSVLCCGGYSSVCQ